MNVLVGIIIFLVFLTLVIWGVIYLLPPKSCTHTDCDDDAIVTGSRGNFCIEHVEKVFGL